ncbi:MAG: alpha/beta hydrolase [Candidatus Ornithospirochaeta sp.]
MKKGIVYIHGKGGSAEGADHYRALFPDSDVSGFSYLSENPWDAKEEFSSFFDDFCSRYDSVWIVAESIGAFFSLVSLGGKRIERAYFISPIVDMECLITAMMGWAGVSEKELEEKKTIPTSFGETLSWEYLSWVRRHPVSWNIPTFVLYSSRDHLQSRSAIESFTASYERELCVMEGGEHWFHTKEEMAYLDKWIRRSLEKK